MARPINERGPYFLTHSPGGAGRCLEHTHESIDLPPAGIPTANAAVDYLLENNELHGGSPPKGAMVLWRSSTFGHAALSLGYSPWRRSIMIASTDVRGPNTTGKVPLRFISERWGHVYAGWSNWYGGEYYDVGYDMPLSDKDIDKIAQAVWEHQFENTTTPEKKKFKAAWFLNSILDKVKS